jgi:hypothetical protein
MADFHVLRMSAQKDRVEVAFHVPIPVEDNAAGKPLRDAVVECYAPAGSEVPYLTAPAVDELTSGAVYEHVETVSFSGNDSNADRLSVIETRAAILQTTVLERLRAHLAFWGYEGSIP